IYWRDARQAASLAGASGFVSCDSMSYYRGDNATKVANAINAGRAIVLYRGAAVGNWYTPFQMNVAGLTNGWRLPIICSFTCATMTIAPGESMVGDAWVKAGTVTTPKGAVAFVGNTHSASNVARVRSALSRGFFTGLFSEQKYELGKAFLRGKQQLYTEYPSYTADYRGFNMFGDPALDVWTSTPRYLEVEHPAAIPPEPQQLFVTVTSGGEPVPGALVCVSMDSVVYDYANTNSSGTVFFDINPTHEGNLRLVVSGHNFIPYDTLIPVHEVGLEELRLLPVRGQYRLSASPALFRHSTTLSWKGPEAPVSLVVSDALGRTVLTAASPGNLLVWNGTDNSGRPVPPGVYVCVLKDDGGRLLAGTRLLRLD
ncbi:MAG: C25 family cysteine peptidase, partial [candidate division WOR-3 bacterium]